MFKDFAWVETQDDMKVIMMRRESAKTWKQNYGKLEKERSLPYFPARFSVQEPFADT